MVDNLTIERRLMTLETVVSDLQRRFDTNAISNHWLERLIDLISNESTFLEALEYGQAFRQSVKPTEQMEN